MQKKLKSTFSIFICFVIIFSMPNITAKANVIDTSDVTISNNEEYIQANFEDLLNEMQTDNAIQHSKTLLANNYIQEDEDVSVYKIQDEELVDEQGDTTGIYAVTYAAIVTDGSTILNKYDESIAVKMYSTIYFHMRTVNGSTEYCLYKVSGGYTKSDNSTAVKSQTVTYSEGGSGSDGNVSYPVTTKSPTGTSWSYSTGYTKYVIKAGIYSGSGCSYAIKLSKGSDSWTCTLPNPI